MNFRDKADVAIIGGGIGGIMTAYRLLEKNPELKVSVIERGHDIEKKGMPHAHKKTDHCIKCATCAIMEGMAGAGAFSDGKICYFNGVRRMADGVFGTRYRYRLYRAG